MQPSSGQGCATGPKTMTKTSCCKVGRVRDDYSMYNLDERLLHKYNAEDKGVRTLEDWFNQLVLERAMEKAGMTVLDGHAGNYYRLLTDDEVLDSERRRAETELREQGVDVDTVKTDFISYRTLLTHLKDCLDIDTSRDYSPDINHDRKQISKMQTRFTNVVEGTLERLVRNGAASIDDPRASISFHVRCGECDRRHNVLDFLSENPVCPCQEAESAESNP